MFYRLGDYESAHQLFGTPKIIKMMRLVPEEKNKLKLASSILEEGTAWTKDNVRGGFGMLRKLMWDVNLHKIYLHELEKEIQDAKKETN